MLHNRLVGVTFMCIDDVLPFTCNELCEMKMELLDDVSIDGISRVICALLNTCQTGINCPSPVSGIWFINVSFVSVSK